jgi:hypothetical protein
VRNAKFLKRHDISVVKFLGCNRLNVMHGKGFHSDCSGEVEKASRCTGMLQYHVAFHLIFTGERRD